MKHLRLRRRRSRRRRCRSSRSPPLPSGFGCCWPGRRLPFRRLPFRQHRCHRHRGGGCVPGGMPDQSGLSRIAFVRGEWGRQRAASPLRCQRVLWEPHLALGLAEALPLDGLGSLGGGLQTFALGGGPPGSLCGMTCSSVPAASSCNRAVAAVFRTAGPHAFRLCAGCGWCWGGAVLRAAGVCCDSVCGVALGWDLCAG